MAKYYVGLSVNGKEPNADTGYARVGVGIIEDIQAIFSPITADCGDVTAIVVYGENGEVVRTIELPEPVNIHAGVIPIVKNEKLFRGVDVSARCSVQLETKKSNTGGAQWI